MSGLKNYPGRRLSFSGALCTVRYVGPVEGTKGDWLGVEWDEPGRGKHDGSHNGVRYFECRSGTNSSSLSFTFYDSSCSKWSIIFVRDANFYLHGLIHYMSQAVALLLLQRPLFALLDPMISPLAFLKL